MGPPDDIEAIRRLKARYFRCLDTKDWAQLETVFAPDVEIDMRGEGGAVTHRAAEFVASLEAVLGPATTVHHGHMPEIELTSPDTATGIWAMEDELWWPAGSPVRYVHGYGHYHETYGRIGDAGGRTGEGWRITTMRLSRLHRIIEA